LSVARIFQLSEDSGDEMSLTVLRIPRTFSRKPALLLLGKY